MDLMTPEQVQKAIEDGTKQVTDKFMWLVYIAGIVGLIIGYWLGAGLQC